MNVWESILIGPEQTIFDAMKIIDSNGQLLIALVVDSDRRLLGTVTDGDIRRGILKNIPMDAPVNQIMHTDPITYSQGDIPIRKRKVTSTRVIPILDADSRVVDIYQSPYVPKKKPNPVLIMAGGLGTRLRPLTENCPKPLLTVGNKPILETIINNFIEHGFSNFFLSINYKGEMIEDYFGDGSERGVTITYLKEKKRLGTAGALSLLNPVPKYPIIVMNGDLLTKINFQQLLDFHISSNAPATLCVREHDFQIPFGVVQVDEDRLAALKEKPTEKMFVNAGIYTLNPEVLSIIPPNQYYDMPDLFSALLAHEQTPGVFPVREYWLDIGRISEYKKADEIYPTLFQ